MDVESRKNQKLKVVCVTEKEGKREVKILLIISASLDVSRFSLVLPLSLHPHISYLFSMYCNVVNTFASLCLFLLVFLVFLFLLCSFCQARWDFFYKNESVGSPGLAYSLGLTIWISISAFCSACCLLCMFGSNIISDLFD